MTDRDRHLGPAAPARPGSAAAFPVAPPGLRLTSLALGCVVYVGLLAGDQELSGVPVRLAVLPLALLGVFALGAGNMSKSAPVPLFLAPLLATLFWLAVTSFWSPEGAEVEDLLTESFTLAVLIVLSAAYIALSSRDELQFLWWPIYLGAIVFAVVALAAGSVDDQGRLVAFGGGPNVFVRIVGMGVVASLALVLPRGLRRGWVLTLPIPVFMVAMVLSGSRGGLLATGVALLYLFWRTFKSDNRRARFALTTGGGVALLGFLTFGWRYVEETVRTRFIEQTLVEGHTSGRDTLLDISFSLIDQNPVFGAGLGSVFVATGFELHHAHNIFVNSTAEGGILALLLLGLTLFVAFREIHTEWDYRSVFWCTSAIFFLVASQTSGDFYDSRFLWFFLLLSVRFGTRDATSDGTATHRLWLQTPP